jgi:hypothetical protein
MPRTHFADFLARDRSVFRVASVERESINYGWAAPLGLQLVTGYEPHNLRHYHEYLQLLQTGGIQWRERLDSVDLRSVTRWDLLDLLNVKYLVARTPVAVPPERFHVVARFADEPVFVPYHGFRSSPMLVYENRGYMARAMWAAEVVGADRETEALRLVRERRLGHVAVVQQAGLRGPVPASVGHPPTVTGAGHGRLSVATANGEPGFLVISEVWHPGWRARLDGTRVPLLRTNHALLGVWIPAGRHTLDLTFVPLGWHAGLAVSGLALLGFVVALAVAARGSGR